MLPITVWMNAPSFYQDDLFRALVATGQVDLEVIFAHELPENRRALGWKTDVAGYSSHFLNVRRPVRDALRCARAQKRRFHIVNGIWAEPAFAAALSLLSGAGSQYAIYSEAPTGGVARSRAKELAQQTFGRPIVRRAAGLLPVAKFGEQFFRGLGASEEQIYPFGYFRKSADRDALGAPARATDSPQAGDKTELVFVGQLVPRKGVDTLLEAVAPLIPKYPQLEVVLIGAGESEAELKQQARRLGIESRVAFEGVVASDAILQRLANARALVLPSRWDGWGLVVNEALSVGVPVFVSDHCGAAGVVRNGENGFVFPADDAAHLRAQLDGFLANPSAWPLMSKRALEMGAAISTEPVASYLVESVRHMMDARSSRPQPPWETLTASWTEPEKVNGKS